MISVLHCSAAIWPEGEWAKATPDEMGLDESRLKQARDYALSGEGSGYIVRAGKLVISWGDPKQLYDLKSTTKSFGAAALGLAIMDGKIRLEDKAEPIALAVKTQRSSAAEAAYPPSPVIKEIQWAPANTIMRMAKGSDNWPMTWGDDDFLYTAYGDGNGFEPQLKQKLSLGLARVAGNPPQILGTNLRSASAEASGDGKSGRKASGLLMVDGILYLLVRNVGNAQLGWSENHGSNWTWADWKFTNSFGCPTFLNFGRNYAGARDDFVYIYSPDSENAYDRADRMILARVAKTKIRQREAYEFFAKLDQAGQPVWAEDIQKRGAVFADQGRCYRSAITFHPTLRRYIWCQTGLGSDPRFACGIAMYDAPEPWGPWTTAYFNTKWDVGPGETSSIPTKWISPGGKSFYLVFSGDDSFSVRQGVLK